MVRVEMRKKPQSLKRHNFEIALLIAVQTGEVVAGPLSGRCVTIFNMKASQLMPSASSLNL